MLARQPGSCGFKSPSKQDHRPALPSHSSQKWVQDILWETGGWGDINQIVTECPLGVGDQNQHLGTWQTIGLGTRSTIDLGTRPTIRSWHSAYPYILALSQPIDLGALSQPIDAPSFLANATSFRCWLVQLPTGCTHIRFPRHPFLVEPHFILNSITHYPAV